MGISDRIAKALSPKSPEDTEAAERAKVIDDLRAAERKVAEIEQSISAQSSEVARLEQEASNLSLIGTDEEYKKTDLAAEAAKSELRKFQRQRDKALELLAEAKRIQISVANKSARGTIQRLNNRRIKAAQGIEEAIHTLAGHWRTMFDVSEKLRAAYPSGIPASHEPGFLTGSSAIKQSVATTLYKFGANPSSLGGIQHTGAPTIIGAQCPDFRLLNQPEALPGIVEEVTAAADRMMLHLEGRLPEPAPALPSLSPAPVPAAGITLSFDDLRAIDAQRTLATPEEMAALDQTPKGKPVSAAVIAATMVPPKVKLR
jgi:hypothetical protein